VAAPKNDNVKQQILDAAILLFQSQHDVSLPKSQEPLTSARALCFITTAARVKSISTSANGIGAVFRTICSPGWTTAKKIPRFPPRALHVYPRRI
jgi:hypothetical protein